MHLKSLTLRGFKSFASATTFEFEPGVTAVVGPNGSGKSNVVDALAWVMGEQGAKTLRGGKMEDVIFAGTSGRPPLGRAQVSLTIDNSDGALPIDYSEVTISRTLFRAGGSEYAINGEGARLLDIQELLSDSGLGREMHVIVGQGQLDRVLHATAEDRRGFIEEAAGVLKHRRRKEKTLRKLDAMQANLTRLTDLTTEIRRQLTPLGKQAQVARRAQTVQFDVRDAKARLLADDLVQLQQALEQDVADESALKARRAEVEKALTAQRAHLAELEQAAASATPRLNAASNAWYQLSTARERLRSLGSIAAERRRHLSSAEQERTGSDPEQLQRQADAVREQAATQEAELTAKRQALEDAVAGKQTAEQAARDEENRVRSLLRAAADRREGLAKLAGNVATARSRVESAQAELERLRNAETSADDRHRKAQQEFTALEQQIGAAETGEESLDAEYEQASTALDDATEGLEDLKAQSQQVETQRQGLRSRLEALRLGLTREDAGRELLAANQPGVLGRLTDQLKTTLGYEAAVATALGAAVDAVLVTDAATGAQAVQWARTDDVGRLDLVLGSASAGKQQENPALEKLCHGVSGAVPALSIVSGKDRPAQNILNYLLAETIVVPDLATGAELVQQAKGTRVTAVTTLGESITPVSVRGGSDNPPSQLELTAAIDQAEQDLGALDAEAERAGFELSRLTNEKNQAQQRADAALDKLNDSDAAMAAVAERLGNLGGILRSTTSEKERSAAAMTAATHNVETRQSELEEIAERLRAAQEAPEETEPDTDSRDELAEAASAARTAEMDSRLALRSGEETLNSLNNRAESLSRAAAAERLARQQAAERAKVRKFQAKKAAAVQLATTALLEYADAAIDRAAAERDAVERLRTEQEAELTAVRAQAEALATDLAGLTDSVHKDELARAQQRAKIEAVEARAMDELSLTADHLVAEYGPETLVPVPDLEQDKWAALRVEVDDSGAPVAQGIPFVREEQEKRLRRAERDLASLGKVNPLALEEFAALEERHQFLSSQLEDLKSSRKDLLEIIREVDQRVEEVFTAAFADTAEQFQQVFATLFPGGEGKLVLTNPDDMLTTGVEVEARPAGKKIKRLSLLSGGERSLTAVALLVAIFKARPSPFYVMDEVEAALDDTNLGRLITIFEQLRESSQLIVITHQKRTMEVADALYGVSMRGDGVSNVISQRLVKQEA